MAVLTWERRLPTELFILKSFQLRFTNTAGCSAFTVRTDTIFNVHILFATLCQQSCYQHGCHIFRNIWYLVNIVSLICLPFSCLLLTGIPTIAELSVYLGRHFGVAQYLLTPWNSENKINLISTCFTVATVTFETRCPSSLSILGLFYSLCSPEKSAWEWESLLSKLCWLALAKSCRWSRHGISGMPLLYLCMADWFMCLCVLNAWLNIRGCSEIPPHPHLIPHRIMEPAIRACVCLLFPAFSSTISSSMPF